MRRRPQLLPVLAALIASLGGCDGSTTPPEAGCPRGAELASETDAWGHVRQWCQVLEDGEPVPHGRWIAWHPNGRKSAEGQMRHGAQVGNWTFWDEAGHVLQVSRFDDDETGD